MTTGLFPIVIARRARQSHLPDEASLEATRLLTNNAWRKQSVRRGLLARGAIDSSLLHPLALLRVAMLLAMTEEEVASLRVN